MSSSVVTRSGAQKAKIQTRAAVKAIESRKPSAALLEAKRKAKLKMNGQKTCDEVLIKDIFQNAQSAVNSVRGETGIVYDESMSEHRCLWRPNHPECPQRFISIIERCNELKLFDRCKRIPQRKATKEEILLKHSEEHYETLKSTSGSTDAAHLEDLCSHYDDAYIHPCTFETAKLAAGCTIDLVNNIMSGKVQNGMAIIRPPGHHAMKSESNGYCIFNNVAIAAQHALDNLKLNRILIVDWDVHHGQGTQQLFYDDPRVVYFSIHRFEYGTFWPNLHQSDFDYIGSGKGEGFNFNLPLNKKGMTNGDYMAIFQQILLPVAVEFQPELIIISAGYDAAIGCPEGEMEITPAFYSHLLNPLLSLANGRVAVVLEGGYCIESLAEGAALTLRSLLGDPCPNFEPLDTPCESIQDSILNCIYAHRPYWKCLRVQSVYSEEELNNINPQPDLHKVIQKFEGVELKVDRYDTRPEEHPKDEVKDKRIKDRLCHLKLITKLTFPNTRLCFVYDDLMTEHENLFENGHPEHPDRIKKIRDRHVEYGLFHRMQKLSSRYATTDELCLAHTRAHVNLIRRSCERNELREIGDTYNSVYFHPKTFECATLAAGSVLQVVDNVLNEKARSGVCIVRPPGHHAESDLPHGFCIFNNIAIAAQYAIRDHGLKRVLIIDWDVHHGNGTQHIFESNPNVLYISVHRFDNGSFFPKSKDADYDVVGSGAGKGFNVNIPWNKKGMGDTEYAIVFQNIIMPIAYEFNPELVLISAGFDAAVGDPLGGCKVTPEAYGHFTHWLSALANGKVIVCLEGGYNVNSISYAMTMCSKALLGDPLPPINISNRNVLNSSCIETMQNVLSVQEKYWKSLKFNKKLPDCGRAEKELSQLAGNLKISQCADNDSVGGGKGSHNESTSGASGGPQPGPSREKPKTLTEFLSENIQALANEEMYAVVPLKNCPHLSRLNPDETPQRIVTSSPCSGCQSSIENWICLHCFQTYCGRYIGEHMLYHHLESDHPLTLSFSDLSVWCYPCEAYIDNPILHKYKNLAHVDKFGEELVWSYGDNTLMLNQMPN
ncbi:histone deacetylase 6 isoform X1 [Hermetia illucens]|uniref:histone deacetylase 6 isoform X1 n=1 Tax=Hermetia illucens TaxID=343691 RepID=UPI0018CC5A0A|nr:histone deacetylase 6 isoform X1 [Hermetia illucens]